MIEKHLNKLILFLTAMLVVLPSYSQDKQKKTTINFEDQLIEGQAQKPDLLYLLKKKKFNYKKLIRLRENFLPELRKTSTEISPVRKIKGKPRE